jgi:Fe2+ or Zn2+ uptake regulation protein
VHSGSSEEYRRSEARKEILELFAKEGEPLSPKDIADAVGMKDKAVRQLLRSMVQDGEVLRHGPSSQSRYTLPEGAHDHHDDHGASPSWEDEDPDMIVIDFSDLEWEERAS